MSTLRTPPGRAGRLRLRHSVDVATRGADLLEQKLRVLRAEHRRLAAAEEAAAAEWRAQAAEAETWLLRGLLLSGEQALEYGGGPAVAEVARGTLMGVGHPTGCTVLVPPRGPDAPAPANTALVHAEAAYRRAVAAAGRYAAARAAARVLAAETAATGQRVRALRRHWLPRLAAALDAVELGLEESEREDAVRRRWAAASGGSDRRGG